MPKTIDPPERDVDWGQRGSQVVVTLACLFIVLGGMKIAANLLLPIVYAFFLAVLSYPLVRWLHKHRWPTPLALGVTMFVNLAVLAGLVTLAVRLCISFYGDLPRLIRGLNRQLGDFGVWLEGNGVTGAKAEIDRLFDWNTLITWATPENIMGGIQSILGPTFGALSTILVGLIMILLLMMFVLMEARKSSDHPIPRAQTPQCAPRRCRTYRSADHPLCSTTTSCRNPLPSDAPSFAMPALSRWMNGRSSSMRA
jgi:AI-2 transport protein TqsA